MGKKGSYFANHRKRIGTEDEPIERKRALPISEEKRLAFEEGQVILLDKPLHWTSFDVVRKIRNAIKIKKVGHAGTLDPLATGLLIICTGKFTKKINEYMAAEKEYTGSFTLGAVTPTYDLESDATDFKDTGHLTSDTIEAATQSFIGHIKQMPPLYSAIKKEGVALYTLARRGKEVELESRDIFIKEFEISSIALPLVYFRVVCSTGTYIRSLAHDFGAALGCGAYLSELRRTRIGEFWTTGAESIDEFVASLQTGNISPEQANEP
ncbi:MAG: tRNA pseudouridine(55) synthase TruB [Chitinophagaceae bacterium]|nr:MAG: tRNA pseudouridine(55) synthase TruB [Chitinophagaceae bacterium]